jgi:ribonuclease BN (tRNA processing enzyme)
MRLQVLGCSGGVGGDLRTTAFLVDDDILLDAGTGVGTLSLDQLRRIDHVFITHSHLDHIASLPLMLDSVAGMRDHPLTVHAAAATIDSLQRHIFNWEIWPDFSQIPNAEAPAMRYEVLTVGQTVCFGARRFTAIPAEHVVPAVGFHLDSGAGSLIFTGDTTRNAALWDHVNDTANLRYLLIETAFSESDRETAARAKHLCPSMLAEELSRMRRSAEVFITHLKPGEADTTAREIRQRTSGPVVRFLENGQVLEF